MRMHVHRNGWRVVPHAQIEGEQILAELAPGRPHPKRRGFNRLSDPHTPRLYLGRLPWGGSSASGDFPGAGAATRNPQIDRPPPLGPGSWGGVAIAAGTVFAVTGNQGATGYVEAFRPDCANEPSGARETGPGSGLVHNVATALDSAGQSGLGSTVHAVNCSVIMKNGL